MKRPFAVIASLLLSITTFSQEVSDHEPEMLPDSALVEEVVRARFDSLSLHFEYEEDISFDDISDNPLFFRLFMPLVLYGSAVSEAITPDSEESVESDNLLPLENIDDGYDNTLSKMIDEALVRIYLEHPELVKMTEAELMNVPGIIPITDDMVAGISLKDTRAAGPLFTIVGL